MNQEEARRRLSAARVAHLATVAADGRPDLVPCCFAVKGDTLYTAVDAKPKSTPRLRRLQNVGLHPEVTLLADAYDEDWTRLWWVRVRGRARVVPEGDDAAGDGLALLAEKYQQYRLEPPRGPVIEVQVYEWRGWSAASAL